MLGVYSSLVLEVELCLSEVKKRKKRRNQGMEPICMDYLYGNLFRFVYGFVV